MLQERWSEGRKVDGYYRITATDWDPRALAMVMDMVHGHHHKIIPQMPQTPWGKLPLAAQVAVIVDYYSLHEATEVYRLLWLQSPVRSWLKTSRGIKAILRDPQDRPWPHILYERDGLQACLYLCTSLVFRDSDVFDKAVQNIIYCCRGTVIDLPELPIHSVVSESSFIISLESGCLNIRNLTAYQIDRKDRGKPKEDHRHHHEEFSGPQGVLQSFQQEPLHGLPNKIHERPGRSNPESQARRWLVQRENGHPLQSPTLPRRLVMQSQY